MLALLLLVFLIVSAVIAARISLGACRTAISLRNREYRDTWHHWCDSGDGRRRAHRRHRKLLVIYLRSICGMSYMLCCRQVECSQQ